MGDWKALLWCRTLVKNTRQQVIIPQLTECTHHTVFMKAMIQEMICTGNDISNRYWQFTTTTMVDKRAPCMFTKWCVPLLKPGYSYVQAGSMATMVLWKYKKSAVGWRLGSVKSQSPTFGQLTPSTQRDHWWHNAHDFQGIAPKVVLLAGWEVKVWAVSGSMGI